VCARTCPDGTQLTLLPSIKKLTPSYGDTLASAAVTERRPLPPLSTAAPACAMVVCQRCQSGQIPAANEAYTKSCKVFLGDDVTDFFFELVPSFFGEVFLAQTTQLGQTE
jgi:hypothetical protein